MQQYMLIGFKVHAATVVLGFDLKRRPSMRPAHNMLSLFQYVLNHVFSLYAVTTVETCKPYVSVA